MFTTKGDILYLHHEWTSFEIPQNFHSGHSIITESFPALRPSMHHNFTISSPTQHKHVFNHPTYNTTTTRYYRDRLRNRSCVRRSPLVPIWKYVSPYAVWLLQMILSSHLFLPFKGSKSAQSSLFSISLLLSYSTISCRYGLNGYVHIRGLMNSNSLPFALHSLTKAISGGCEEHIVDLKVGW